MIGKIILLSIPKYSNLLVEAYLRFAVAKKVAKFGAVSKSVWSLSLLSHHVRLT